jgi:hypothetical protein
LRGEGGQERSDLAPDRVGGAPGGFSEQGFEFGEDLLDGVEVGTVFREEEELGAGGADGAPHGLSFVAAEIVDDDDIARLERRDEDLLDIGEEAVAVDRPVDDAWSGDAIAAERGEEGQRASPALRRRGDELLASRCPATQGRHVGLGPGLVDEDQPRRVKPALIELPLPPPSRHVGAILLGGEQRFF